MGRAFTTREPQYVADSHLDKDFIQAPGAELTRSELALPVVTGQRVRAIVNLEHRDTNAFGPAERATLVAFVHMMEEALARLDALAALSETTANQEFMARLNRRLLLTDGVTEAAEAALDEIMAMFDLDLGVVLELHYARLRPIAVHGSPPPVLAGLVRDGFPFTGLLRHAWEARELVLVDDLASDPDWSTSTEARAVAAVPIVDQGQMQALLVVTRIQEPLPKWGDRTRELLGELSVPLGAAFARATLNRQLFATLEAIKQLKSTSSPEALYRHAAIAAADLVPNAEAVSILVRHGESFHYEAAVGYDLDRLQAEAGPFTYGEQLAWYRGDVTSFEGGAGRIVLGTDSLTMSAGSGQMLVASAEARLNDLRCQLAVPIVDREGVVAFLNVDNFSTDDAFGPAALRIAEAFAQHLTVVVRQAEHMLALERSAITDPLTGLGNREGFNRAFKLELARARRSEHHLSLMVLDLNDFKEINDRFGHSEGDKALVAVANALAGAARGSDQVFRWGGDEFAIVMPEARLDDAQAAAERLGRVVAGLTTNGVALSISIGVANYPVDGLDREALMEVSDHRMYESKRAGGVTATHHSRRSGSLPGLSSVAALAGTPPVGGRGTPVNAGRDSK
jgi:diguanylate cyclase (GGDEF)-like protein